MGRDQAIQFVGHPHKPGPEADLVNAFLGSIDDLPMVGNKRTVLIEPLINGSRPDIVVVDWQQESMAELPSDRPNLSVGDLKLLHYIYINRETTVTELTDRFRRFNTVAVERLEDAGMICLSENGVYVSDFSRAFIPRRIASFEAKVDRMNRAVQQAFRNTWFSSHSFILTPTHSLMDATIENLVSRGVGLWFGSNSTPEIVPEVQAIPASYGSWVVNELIWQIESGRVDDV